jgi:hypothetical protein
MVPTLLTMLTAQGGMSAEYYTHSKQSAIQEKQSAYWSKQILSLVFFETLSSAQPYEFLVKLRNTTSETNDVIVSQNALGMMGRRFVNPLLTPPSCITECPLPFLRSHYKIF